MFNSTFLQIFLLVNVFIIGMLVPIAIRHARAHFRPTEHEVEKPHPHAATVSLPPAIKEHLLLKSQANFQAVLNRSAAELQHDLKNTTVHLNKQLEKFGNDIIDDEMKRYRSDIDQLRKQAQIDMSGAQTEITKHQSELMTQLDQHHSELEAEMNEKIKTEEQRLIQNIDTKLADAVASFLTETLQHNVDLGAQEAYLMATLEEHKSEIAKGISNEA